MVVMKFGGTSMGSAERMLKAAEIIQSRAAKGRVGVIVSAVGGVSNRLQAAIDQAIADFALSSQEECECGEAGEDAASIAIVSGIIETHEQILSDIATAHPSFNAATMRSKINPLFDELKRLVKAIAVFGECPDTIYCRVMGMGERLCLPIAAEILRASGADVLEIDIRDYIIIEGNLREGEPVLSKINERFAPLRDDAGLERVVIGAGFIASDEGGRPALLGRNGSDFSAALMAMGVKAARLEIWTDVDGIFTADPRIVPDAQLVKALSYEEAAELSFFGSKVLHPKTLGPLAACGIETLSLNSFNPQAPGTRIAAADKIPPAPDEQPVRGVTVLKDVACISVSGIGLKGRRGSAARIFNAASGCGVSVLLITQSSSEYSVTFCVRQKEAGRVIECLNDEFALELRERLVNPISQIPNAAIVSIVGDAMKENCGIAGKFFSSLSFASINIIAIAQGSSERSISAVIDGEAAEKAVRIVHSFLFNRLQHVDVFLFGLGAAGTALLEQIREQQQKLLKSHIDIRVCAISDLKRIAFFPSGILPDTWREALESSDEPFSVERLFDFLHESEPLNPVFVDCSLENEEEGASDDAFSLAWHYPEIFSEGMNIVTQNTIANTLPYDFYLKMHGAAQANKKRFLYGSSVGTGLPVIEMLRTMEKTGDALIHFEGIMSGAFSFVFSEIEKGLALSAAADLFFKESGFSGNAAHVFSPDPMKRACIVLAREAGIAIEVADVKAEPFLPSFLDLDGLSRETFIKKLSEADSWFAQKIEGAAARGKKLRYAACIDCSRGSPNAFVGFVEVAPDSPLAADRLAESIFAFTTRRYSPYPLVLQGFSSNVETSASGLFADILRTATW